MTIVQLEYIVALHTFRHFSKAAARCHITQPSLSMQIQKLEQELGVQIFSRTTPVETTAIGERIVEQAKKVLAGVEQLRFLVDQDKGVVSGGIKLGVIPTVAPYVLPLFVGAFSEKVPGVKLEIFEMTTEHIVRRIRKGTLDAGIMATPLHLSDLREDFLYSEQFLAFVSPGEKLFRRKTLDADELDLDSMWLMEEGHCLRNQVVSLCAIREASEARSVVYAAGSIETLKQFVIKNGGYTLLPELATMELDKSQKEMLRPFRKPAPAREISLVYPRTFAKKQLLEVLRETLLAHLPSHVLDRRGVNTVPAL